MVRYGRGRVRLARKHRDTVSLRTSIPLLFVLGVMVGGPLSLVCPWLAGPYLATLAIYLTTVLVVSPFLGDRRGAAMLLWLPLALATIHFGSGTGMLLELIAPGRGQPSRGNARYVDGTN